MLQPGVQEEVKNLHATMEKHLSRQELLMEAPELRRLVNWMCGVVTIPNHCFREIDDRYLEMSGLKLQVRFPSKINHFHSVLKGIWGPICLFLLKLYKYFGLAASLLTYKTR